MLFYKHCLKFLSVFEQVTENAVSWYLYLFVCFDCRQVSSNDYSSLDTLTKTIVKEKQPFIRLEMSKEDLLEMFKVLLTVCLFFISVNLSWKTDCSIYFENPWKMFEFQDSVFKVLKVLEIGFQSLKAINFYWARSKSIQCL